MAISIYSTCIMILAMLAIITSNTGNCDAAARHLLKSSTARGLQIIPFYPTPVCPTFPYCPPFHYFPIPGYSVRPPPPPPPPISAPKTPPVPSSAVPPPPPPISAPKTPSVPSSAAPPPPPPTSAPKIPSVPPSAAPPSK